MCIAAIISVPLSADDLKLMDESNPHGGGVAWVDCGELRFRRGLGPGEIHAMQESGELTLPYLLHFRWATQGDRVPELTHPFPIGLRAMFGELEGTAESVLIHNGTWSMQDRWLRALESVPSDVIESASDTAIIAWLLQDNPHLINQVRWATAIGTVRAGVLHVETTGTWTEHEGNQYSNLHWLPARRYWEAGEKTDLIARKRAWTIPSHSAWDWDEYWEDKDDTLTDDLVTEDPEAVNKWLAERMIG
jgi:predicted glutamine amidotransferase